MYGFTYDSGSKGEYTVSASRWRAWMREQMREQGDDTLEPILAFCDRRDLAMPVDLRVDLWGFGKVRVLAGSDDESQLWVVLDDLAEPLGVDHDTLLAAWTALAEHAGEDGCVDRIGDRRLVEMYAVLLIFIQASPWAPELIKNLTHGPRRAAADAGRAYVSIDGITAEQDRP